MAKLYPPQLQGVTPAFYTNIIQIPFNMNHTVAIPEVKGMYLKIKTVQENKTLTNEPFYSENIDFVNGIATFDLGETKLLIGQFYKIQLAYKSAIDGEIGHYSDLSVTKFTTKPIVTIQGLEVGNTSLYQDAYTGVYEQPNDGDYSEKVGFYRFEIWDNEDNKVYDSGELAHYSPNDTDPYTSSDTQLIPIEIQDNKIYYIRYTIETINKMRVSSPRYRIFNTTTFDSELSKCVDLYTKNNFEEGYIDISFIWKKEASLPASSYCGNYVLKRRENKTKIWETLSYFELTNKSDVINWHWKDFTTQQGLIYEYAIQQFHKNIYTNPIKNKTKITADFEHAFLFDGKRQLKIKYDPKISSFKTTHLESKVDTLGSKYPFIFRNGYTAYKEFPISGLVSYLLDDENLFLKDEDFIFQDYKRKDNINWEQVKTTNLVGENISRERKFKLEVLDWLNDGKPKLFRSPTEGNYIVRLMNISLSPNDTVGRMLHTFTCTAYEIAELNYNNLVSYNFINNKYLENNDSHFYWSSIHIDAKLMAEKASDKTNGATNNILPDGRIAKEIYIEDMQPGDKVSFLFSSGKWIVEMPIGKTGSFALRDTEPIQGVFLYNTNKSYDAIITYLYEGPIATSLDLIENINYHDIGKRQIYGIDYLNKDILEEWKDVKTEKIKQFSQLKVIRRPIENLYSRGPIQNEGPINKLYPTYKNMYQNTNYIENLSEDTIYPIYYPKDWVKFSTNPNSYLLLTDKVIANNFTKYFEYSGYYVDGKTKLVYKHEHYDPGFSIIDINGNRIDYDLSIQNLYNFENIELQELYLGTGVIAELSFTEIIKKYSFENELYKQTFMWKDTEQSLNWPGHLNNYYIRSKYFGKEDPFQSNSRLVDENLLIQNYELAQASYQELIKRIENEITRLRKEGGYIV